MVLQNLADLRQGHHNNMLLQGMGRSPSIGGGDGILLLPLTLGNGGSGGDVQISFSRINPVAAFFLLPNLFTEQQMFLEQQTAPMPSQTFGGVGGATAAGRNHNKPGGRGGGVPAPPRQRVRALPGQTTNLHSIEEQFCRERIAERIKALKELVPKANKMSTKMFSANNGLLNFYVCHLKDVVAFGHIKPWSWNIGLSQEEASLIV